MNYLHNKKHSFSASLALKGLMLMLFMMTGTFSLSAQIVKMTASAPAVVEVGERFMLTYTINFSDSSSNASLKNASISNFTVPGIRGVKFISQNPSESQSTSMSVINGKMQSSREISYTFVLQAVDEGTFTIEPASCEVSGTKYTSNALTLEIVAGSNGAAASSGSNSQAGTQSQTYSSSRSSTGSSSGNELFFRIVTDKKTVYQGEAVTAQVKLFSKVSVSSLQGLNLPSFDGFYKQEVKIPQLTQLTRENVNGEVYGTGVLTKYVLFPQKTGEITIGTASLDVEVAQRVQVAPSSWFDDFFMPQTQYVSKTLTAPENVIKVQPLPSEGKPASFNGAVGQYTLKGQMDKTVLKANESATLKLVLSGKGNIKLANVARSELPPDFDTYDPKITNSIQDDGISGTKTIEYLMIPRHEGTYVIPAVTFSYFDPQTATYHTLSTDSYTLTVEKGDELMSGSSMVSGLSREELKFLGQDIRHIRTRMPQFTRADSMFFLSGAYFAWFLGLTALFVLILMLLRRHIRRNADETARRYRHAGRSARKRMRKAHEAMQHNQVEQFYEETSKALWGFLSDKLAIPMSELSKSSAEEALRRRGCDEAMILSFGELIDTCEMARYAPQSVSHDLKTVYGRTVDLISKI